jgi:hypothetical protein
MTVSGGERTFPVCGASGAPAPMNGHIGRGPSFSISDTKRLRKLCGIRVKVVDSGVLIDLHQCRQCGHGYGWPQLCLVRLGGNVSFWQSLWLPAGASSPLTVRGCAPPNETER